MAPYRHYTVLIIRDQVIVSFFFSTIAIGSLATDFQILYNGGYGITIILMNVRGGGVVLIAEYRTLMGVKF